MAEPTDRSHARDRCLLGLFAGMRTGRVIDLETRRRDGTLSSLEKLCLLVLTGGPDAETAVGPLVDAVQEEYANATYRVPVRVIGDRSRLKVVASIPPDLNTDRGHQELAEAIDQWKKGPADLLIIKAGVKLEMYEFGEKDRGGQPDDAGSGVG